MQCHSVNERMKEHFAFAFFSLSCYFYCIPNSLLQIHLHGHCSYRRLELLSPCRLSVMLTDSFVRAGEQVLEEAACLKRGWYEWCCHFLLRETEAQMLHYWFEVTQSGLDSSSLESW